MRDPNRISIILKRLEHMNKHSDLRLGQIFVNSYSSLEQKGINMFSIEDDELLNELENLFEQLSAMKIDNNVTCPKR